MLRLAAQELSFDELYARGEDVYNASCLACHGAKGEGGLGNAIAGSTIATGGLDAHLSVIVNGVAGSAMQAFGAQLSEVDVAAVTTYQRNAFGNNTGDVVQASDVVSYKEG
jgi:cytochrome c oxidase subunit 2